MKHKTLLFCSICAFMVTVFLGYLFSERSGPSTVMAQTGCWQTLPTKDETCYCESFAGSRTVADISNASGIGRRGTFNTLIACNYVAGSCDQEGSIPYDDITCPTMTPTPTPTPTPPPTPEPTPTPDDLETCTCSPIVIDTLGNGFDLTNMQNGVRFDLDGDGVNGRLSWTSANSDDAWLALDNNGNGQIDDGTELFGNFTAQPEPPPGVERNGFRALAVFDTPANGGNNDGRITAADAIFGSLRLWQDLNHNGRSERRELRPLAYHGLAVIELDYESSTRTDQYGNQFKYRARIRDVQGVQAGRWAWDVFLVGTNP